MNSSSIDTPYIATAEIDKADNVRIRQADVQDKRLLSQIIRAACRNVEKINDQEK